MLPKCSTCSAWLSLLIGLITPACLVAQWANHAREWRFGSSQTVGQSPDFFPQNVLGPTDPNASRRVPSADPKHICSLGRDGWLILEFDPPISNGDGYDFIVFENAFEYGNGRIYDEWIKIEVSSNGRDWYVFPYDSLTGTGFAGRTPTEAGSHLAIDPALMGGDAFDLDVISLETARFIRLTDATKFQPPDRLGADLDAVFAIHQAVSRKHRSDTDLSSSLTYNAMSKFLTWNGPTHTSLRIWSLQGLLLYDIMYLDSGDSLSLAPLSKGVYFVEAVFINEFPHRKKILVD